MSDDKSEGSPPLPPIEPAEFPEGHLFPNEILEQWVKIPATEPLMIGPLTRGDIDHLLFSFKNVTMAISNLHQGLVEFSNGRIDQANAFLQNATNRTIDGSIHSRLLFEAIMKSIIEARKYASK
jgi:hypothetical protein